MLVLFIFLGLRQGYLYEGYKVFCFMLQIIYSIVFFLQEKG